MAQQFLLTAYSIVQLLQPATDAAGRTSANYISMKGAHKAYIIFTVQQGSASTILLSPLQGTSAAGAGSKAVNAVPIWSNLDESVTDALTSRTAAATYTTDAATKNKIVVFEIDPSNALDVANAFDYVGFSTGASSASNLTQAIMIVVPGRYVQATPPTAIT